MNIHNTSSFEDFQILTIIDETHQSTTRVYLTRRNNQIHVCKAISKEYLKDAKKFEHLKNEREALQHFTSLKHKNINHLIEYFQDQDNCYLVLSPAFGLPLHKLIKMGGLFKPKMVSLVVTQVAWILRDFHKNNFIYRDIKASNFIMDLSGKITMIDLGLAKKIQKKRTKSICGTLHAMPPEVFTQEGYDYGFDYYGFGILVYELTVGLPPFGYEMNNPNIKQDIKKGVTLAILDRIYHENTRDLIKHLLSPAVHRLGKDNGFQQILSHPYFESLELEKISKIYEGKGEDLALDFEFQQHRSQIEDFGIEASRYQQIQEDDPFYKFN